MNLPNTYKSDMIIPRYSNLIITRMPRFVAEGYTLKIREEERVHENEVGGRKRWTREEERARIRRRKKGRIQGKYGRGRKGKRRRWKRRRRWKNRKRVN